MNWIKSIKYWIHILSSNFFVRGSFLVALLGVFLAKPWELKNLYQLNCIVLDWNYLIIGPVLAFLIILATCYSSIQNEVYIFHFQSRDRLFSNLVMVNFFSSLCVSVWMNTSILIIGGFCYHFRFVENNTEIGKQIKSIYDVLAISLRTTIMLWIFLFLVGLFYFIVEVILDKVAGGALIAIGVVGIEQAYKFYFGNQLFMKYAFPMDTVLYISDKGFLTGVLYLLLFAFVLGGVLFGSVWKKDLLFIKKR